MKTVQLGLVSLSLLGLIACGGSGGNDSGDNDNGGVNTTPLVTISASDVDINRILVGSAHPLDRSFYVDANVVTKEQGPLPLTTQIAQLSHSIIQFNAQQSYTNADGANYVPSAVDINYSVSAISSDPAIAKIENGHLVGVSPGKASITYTITSDSISINDQQVTLETGEITVCPFDHIALKQGNTQFNEGRFLNYSAEPLEISSTGEGITLTAFPIITDSTLSTAGLTPFDCPSETSINNQGQMGNTIIGGHYINQVTYDSEGNTLVASNTLHDGNYWSEPDTASVRNLLGLNFSHITRTFIDPADISNVRITELGYDSQIANLAANPIKVMGFSTVLNRDVDVTALYTAGYSQDNYGGQSRGNPFITVSNAANCNEPLYCIEEGQKTAAITLAPSFNDENREDLPAVTSETLPLFDARLDFSIHPKTVPINEIIEMSSELIINGKKYDASNFITNGGNSYLTDTNVNYSPDTKIQFGKWVMFKEIGIGMISAGIQDFSNIGLQTNKVEYFKVGLATEANIQGRWLQADNGLDYYIGAFDPLDFSVINENQLTYQSTDGNTTTTLLRAGIDNVAVSGSVNIVTETSAQVSSLQFTGSKSLALTPNANLQASGLSGIANIDLVLENVNTGEKTEVHIEADGSFSESVPTGIYDVVGTVIDGSIIYNIDTRITVEKDATDTGTLNLAKVGLYNFDISITKGCDHNHKCYAGKQYEFIITAKNTGVIASSSIEAAIDNILAHENVTQFSITSNPITGAASGDSIEYRFTATFSQPALDTVIEMPISLTDIDGRTWDDAVQIKLSQYPSIDVNIKAYNDSLMANVRGYLMLEGRTPIRVDGPANAIKVPNKPGASYELILANQVYNQETPYAVSVNKTVSNQDISDATGIISKNENADDAIGGATELTLNEENIAYISAGDVDYYLINIPEAP